jgi:transcriptional regulator with XRE-family HTH domain
MQITLESGPDIRALRRSRRVSLNRMAVLLGVSTEGLRAVERGELPPHPETLEKARDVIKGVDNRRLKGKRPR